MSETHIHMATHAPQAGGPGGWGAILVTPEGKRHTLGGCRTSASPEDIAALALSAAMDRPPRAPNQPSSTRGPPGSCGK